jgi:arylamine N-acetyltransferase
VSWDLARYFARIDYRGPTEPTLETLHGLVTAHEQHIPFENIDPVMGFPVEALDRAALFEKMVLRQRGGYCFEQNGLMRYVLTDLGFDVDPLTGRVVWMSAAGLDSVPTALTHHVLAVRIPGAEQRYLVDVGFGGQTPSSPLILTPDAVQQTRHEPYRLRRFGAGYALETLIGERWQPLYTFTDEPRPMIDMQVGSWYVSTHPTSMFVTGLSAAMVTDDARWNLRGRNLSVHHADGGRTKTRFDSASQVLALLIDRFGIDVGGLGDVHARITQVLDT